eukprot:jgi/Hompol1/5448/HPOL_001699-RA
MPSNPTKFSAASIPDQSGKVFIVTGGNSGIGYECCLALAAKGAHVFMASRSEEKATKAIESIKKEVPSAKIEFLQLQLSDLKQTQAAGKAFAAKGIAVDCLINNAGIFALPFALTKDGIEEQFHTNYVGHFVFTREVLPALLKAENPRIVNVSSGLHNGTLPQGILFDSMNDEKAMTIWQRYAQSKLSNILFTMGLNKRFGDKIYANSVDPGYVATGLDSGLQATYGSWIKPIFGLLKRVAALDTKTGALTSLYAATSPDIVTKNFKDHYLVPIAAEGTKERSALAKDAALGEKLWDFTEQLVAQKLGA